MVVASSPVAAFATDAPAKITVAIKATEMDLTDQCIALPGVTRDPLWIDTVNVATPTLPAWPPPTAAGCTVPKRPPKGGMGSLENRPNE